MTYRIIDKISINLNTSSHPFYDVSTTEEVLTLLDKLYENHRDLVDKAYFWCQTVDTEAEFVTDLFVIKVKID